MTKEINEDVTIDDILEVAKTYITKEESLALIMKAYDFVMDKHHDQKRKSGQPYTIHLLWVAYILANLQTGPTTIAAGLLHDVMEDCGVTRAEMVELFGEEVAYLVEGVTKIGNMPFKDETEMFAENHRKIYIAMAKDIRVIIIKLADRLHNMRTLQYLPENKQKRISKETMEVYAPLAHRLGINDIRIELEDLSLFYLDNKAYHEIAELLEVKRSERKEAVDRLMYEIKELLDVNNIPFRILGRAKHIYSIYKKMVIKQKSFDELYDLNAIRIICDDVMSCYAILGVIHANYRPLPGRFKDYIAMPKPNMYQSLHTAILNKQGQIFEVQIRTVEMDLIAERGIAAHWRYKENKKYSSSEEQKEIGSKLQWLSDFITMSDDMQDADAKEYYDSLRHDIFDANVYVLTPKGKIIELPNGSTPIDFAYRIHTDIGHKTVGALVNNVMVPIDTKLKTGDVVEMKTSKQSPGPSEDWLKFVRTAGAKNKIRSFFAAQLAAQREDVIEDGRKTLKEEIRRREVDEKVYFDPKTYEQHLNAFGATSFDDLLYFMGKKALTAYALLDKVMQKKPSVLDGIAKMLKKNNNKQELQKMSSNNLGIVVAGVTGLKVSLSKCCNPIPGDDIVGFVSKGQGVKVHTRNCPNVQDDETKKRLIDVYWDHTLVSKKRFDVDLQMIAYDRTNTLLNDVITTLGQLKVNILNISANTKDAQTTIDLKISVESADLLEQVIANLKKIHGMYEVNRVIH